MSSGLTLRNALTGKQKHTFTEGFTGARQDFGDPASFVKIARDFYKEEGIKDAKTIVFPNFQHRTLSGVQKDCGRGWLKVELWCGNFLYE
jgi:hypothetical protein